MKRITLLLVFLFLFSAISIAQQKKYISYTVKSGENIKSIARDYDISFKDLLRLNPDVSRNPEPNTIIIVPNKNYGKNVVNVAAVNDKFHAVKPKETLYGISKMYGVSVEELIAANPELKNGLKIGMNLEIPEGNKIKHDGDINYEFHWVVKDDTLYNLSKRYHITQTELIRLNPSLKDGLKIGLELVVPKISEASSGYSSNYEYHTVIKDDTLYNLSKRYQVSQVELLRLNPELSEGLKLGMVLKIKSLQNGEFKKDEIEENFNFKEKLDFSKEINLVMLLPYQLNTLSDSIRSENFRKNHSLLNIVTDFHLGATMAIDSLRKRGLNIKVKFLDSENSTQKLQSLINKNNFKEVDAVIGPFYFESALWLSKHIDSPVIVPFYSKSQTVNSNSNLVKVGPENNLLESELLKYLEQHYHGENIVVINDGKSESQSKLWQTVNKLKTFINIQNVSVVKSQNGYISRSDISEKLNGSGGNWVLLVSDEMVTTAAAVNNLKSLVDNFKITLIAFDKGKNFDSVDNNLLGKLNFIFPTLEYLNIDDNNVNNFYKNYQAKNYVIPSKYALKGFDITYDILARIASENGLKQGLEAGRSSRTSTMFSFNKNLAGSFENQGIYIIQYNTALTPIVLNN
ncbi:MAG: LysM peptidoglycan-binding domain-containing protein [Lutibacter sp.]|nr:LysM peptidoglycan-binding domain-containing protein [Lutibacter sp.]